jgi:hypothetical protein
MSSINVSFLQQYGSAGGIRTHGFTVLQAAAFDHSATALLFIAHCYESTSNNLKRPFFSPKNKKPDFFRVGFV